MGDLEDFRTAIPHTRAAREEAPAIPSSKPEITPASDSEADDAKSFATSISRLRLREEAAAPEIRVPFPPLP